MRTRLQEGPERTDLRGGAVPVGAFFTADGLAVGVFGGSLPGLRAALDLGAGQIATLLVTAGLVAVVSMNLGGRVADRSGALTPTVLGAVVMGVGVLVVAAAPSYAVALVGAGLFGLGNGAMDVCMNALGVGVEKRRHRPVMSRLHAFFSVGGFVGALLVVAAGPVLGTDRAYAGALCAGVLLLLVVVATATPRAPRIRPEPEPQRGGARRIPPLAWLLAAMAIGFGLTEGTAIDWSSLHVTDVGGVSPSTGAWGLACVSGFMVVIRLVGDLVVERLGRATVVRAGAGVALVGFVLTAFTSALPAILGGWCLVGLGVGLIAPQIYGMAGHLGGGRGLALVVSFGYTAFLVGPALIGFVVRHSDLQRAMLVPTVSAVALIVLSVRLPADDPARTPSTRTVPS